MTSNLTRHLEGLQGCVPFSIKTANSSYRMEDLVSNLIGDDEGHTAAWRAVRQNPGMTQFRLFLAIVAATVALFAAATALLIWMSPYTLRETTLSFSLGSKPRGLLKTMGVPEGAYNLSGISVVGPDGTMPEIATRSFEIRSNPKALRQFFETKCKEAGLGPADADHLRMEPDLLCSFHAPGVNDAVLLSSTCTADTCRVTVEASRVTI